MPPSKQRLKNLSNPNIIGVGIGHRHPNNRKLVLAKVNFPKASKKRHARLIWVKADSKLGILAILQRIKKDTAKGKHTVKFPIAAYKGFSLEGLGAFEDHRQIYIGQIILLGQLQLGGGKAKTHSAQSNIGILEKNLYFCEITTQNMHSFAPPKDIKMGDYFTTTISNDNVFFKRKTFRSFFKEQL